MLISLIKLSKELSDLDFVEESLEIENLISRLYGLPISEYHPSLDGANYLAERARLEDISEVVSNPSRECTSSELSDILISSLSHYDLEIIKESLENYLD